MLKVHVAETPSSRPRSSCYVHQSSCYVHQSSCYVIRKLSEFPLRLMVLHNGIIATFKASVPRARYVIAMSLLRQCYVGVACIHAAFALDAVLPTKILNMLRVHLEENLSSETKEFMLRPSKFLLRPSKFLLRPQNVVGVPAASG